MENEPISQSEKDKTKYIGFGIRLISYIIDTSIFTTIAYSIWGDEIIDSTNGFQIHFSNEQLLIPIGYIILSWYLLSSSIGKLIFGVKIVDENGNRLKLKTAFLRLIGYLLLPIGCWFIIGNRKKQALHDKVADTFVVRM
jgi:uncharacterized RDD family membrane protein YckC